MANIFKKIGRFFGLSSQKKAKPAPTLMEQPGQRDVVTTLQERIRGRGIGIPKETLSGVTSAHARQQRAGLREQTIPTISAQASARGLGRSTIPVGQIGQASGAVERDIAERVAQLRLADAEMRQANIERALAQLGGFGQASQAAAASNAALMAGDLRARQATEQAGIGRTLALAGSILGGMDLFGGGGTTPLLPGR